MASSSWSAFAKTILIPMLIALSLYVVIFLILLPLYRRYRSQLARYSSYTPLSSGLAQQTTSLFEPYLIEPSKTLLQKMREAFVKGLKFILLPSAWARQGGMYRGAGRPWQGGAVGNGDDDDDDDDDNRGGLFDAESGEAMVGFDFQQGERGRGRQREVDTTDAGMDHIVDDSNRRLSRELEQGFRDDSGSEATDEEVTIGRRTLSRRGSEIRR